MPLLLPPLLQVASGAVGLRSCAGMAALLVLALAFTLLLPWHVEARRHLAQALAPGPAAHAQGNEAAQSTTSLPSSAYVTGERWHVAYLSCVLHGHTKAREAGHWPARRHHAHILCPHQLEI